MTRNATARNGFVVEQVPTDAALNLSGTDLVVPSWADKLVAALAVAGHSTAANHKYGLRSPSLRNAVATTLQIRPIDEGSGPIADAGVPLGIPHPSLSALNDYRFAPVPLQADEPLSVASDTANVADPHAVAVWLASRAIVQDYRPSFRMRFTTALTLGTTGWGVAGTITPEENLAEGSYDIVGGYARAPNGLFWRLLFQGQSARPGAPFSGSDVPLPQDLQNSTSFVPEPTPAATPFQAGRFGVWGRMTNKQLPTIEGVGISADTNPDLYLDLVPVSGGSAWV